MHKQDRLNHVRYYTPHHFIFYPLMLLLLVMSVLFISRYPDKDTEWKMFAALVFVIAWFSFMVRQHYALTLQNRIVRLEMRLRYYQLTGQRLDTIEPQLEFGQIAALRFASDEELPALVKQTIDEQLKPAAIKKLIKNWQADHMRV